jgi:hypothetical protein
MSVRHSFHLGSSQISVVIVTSIVGAADGEYCLPQYSSTVLNLSRLDRPSRVRERLRDLGLLHAALPPAVKVPAVALGLPVPALQPSAKNSKGGLVMTLLLPLPTLSAILSKMRNTAKVWASLPFTTVADLTAICGAPSAPSAPLSSISVLVSEIECRAELWRVMGTAGRCNCCGRILGFLKTCVTAAGVYRYRGEPAGRSSCQRGCCWHDGIMS